MENQIVQIYKTLTPACKWRTEPLIYDEIEKRKEDICKLNQLDFHMEIQQYTLESNGKVLKPPNQQSNQIYEYKFSIKNLLPESQRIYGTMQIINNFGIKIGKIQQSTTQGLVEIDHSQFQNKQNQQQQGQYLLFFLGYNVFKMKYRLSNVVEVKMD